MARLFFVFVLALGIEAAARADWPQWRGPKRDGHAISARLPKTLPKELPKPLWKVKLGHGYSGPVIAGGNLYILHLEPGDMETALCLDASSGKQIWKKSYHSPYTPPDPTAGVGPKSTPTVDGNRVYTFGAAGMLHCFDAKSGKILWKKDCQKDYWGDEKNADGDNPNCTACGAAASPLILGPDVILPVGGAKAGGMTAFDKLSGNIHWKSLPDRSSYASPILAEPAGLKQIIGFTGIRMVGLQQSDGTLLWDHPFPAKFDQTMITPVVHKELVVIAGESKPALALRLLNQGGKIVKKEAWRNNDMRLYLVSPIAYKDHLYGHNVRGQLVCVSLLTGKTAWAEGDFDQFASLVLADNRLLVMSRNGALNVVEANPKEHNVLATYQASKAGGVWSHMAVDGGRIYVRDKAGLMCFDMGGK